MRQMSYRHGKFCVENVAPNSEVLIQSNVRNSNQLSSDNSSYYNCPENETTNTRISSGYFSGDEFRSYYLNNNNNNANNQNNTSFLNYVNSGSPTISSSTTTDNSLNQSKTTGYFTKINRKPMENKNTLPSNTAATDSCP